MAESVVIVGAGLGGLRTAEALRGAGFEGAITVVGDEPSMPYNRPPLSKVALSGGVHVAELEFRRKASVADVEWRLGAPAIASDFTSRTITLADGTQMSFDGLVIASGIRPRRLPIPGPETGRYVLRTAHDATGLRNYLAPGRSAVIMGAGFIGCEVAATARGLGCEVHIVAIDEQPMFRPLGAELGRGLRSRHEQHGVNFHLGRTVQSFLGGDRVNAVLLDDGTELPASVVVEAVGSVCNVEWLEGNGLDLTDGVLVDQGMVVDCEVPIVAAGDVARHPNSLFGNIPRRIEHWNMPTETGRRAGASLAALLRGQQPDPEPFAAMPSFWSDQYHHKIQSFGMPGIATSIQIVDGSPDDACIFEYSDDTGLVGVVGVDRTAELSPYRKQLLDR